MALRLGFLVESCLVKLSFQVFYRDSHTNPYIFVGTELGTPVLLATDKVPKGSR